MIDFEELINLQHSIVIISNIRTKQIIYGNNSFNNFFGMSVEEFKDKNDCICNCFLPNEDYLVSYMHDDIYWLNHMLKHPTERQRVLMENVDGYFYHFTLYAKKINNDEYIVVFDNITHMMYVHEELEIDKQILNEYKKAVDESAIVSKTNTKGIITYVNKKFCDISGYKKDELIGKSHNIVRHSDMPKDTFKEMWKIIKTGLRWNEIIKNKKKNGDTYIVDATISPIMDKDGNIKEYIAICKDITQEYIMQEQIELQNRELIKVASFDPLTNSYNRRFFDELILNELEKYKEDNEEFSLIMLDLDNFKNVNDTHGHDVGDEILVSTVSIIKNILKNQDIVARYGGEEFVVLLPDTELKNAVKIGEKIREKIENNTFDKIKNITVSIGVSSIKEVDNVLRNEERIKKMIKIADIFLYEAKKMGKNRVVSSLDTIEL